MLLFNIVPMVANNFFQKLLRNILSLSVMMDFGMSCFLTILSMNVSATCLAKKGCFMEIK